MTAEELNVVRRGRNYGWPCFEGRGRTPRYGAKEFCTTYYREKGREAVKPAVAIPWPEARSLTAGAFLRTATRLPSRYRSSYLFGDWLVNKLWLTPTDTFTTDAGDGSVRELGRNPGGPVTISVGPDGAVYYLALNVGELRRITGR